MRYLMGCFLVAGQLSGLYATEESDLKFSGSFGSFTKAGFNHQKLDVAQNKYPTESYSTIFGQFDSVYSAGLGGFTIDTGLGITTASFLHDSTKTDGAAIGRGLDTGSGLNNLYVGGRFGSLFNKTGSYDDNRYFVLHNAFVDAKNSNMRLRVGRYLSDADYYSAWTQGFSLDVFFGYGDMASNPDNQIRLWWMSGFGRAFPFTRFLIDYYPVKTTDSNKDGKNDKNYGVHAAGLDIKFGGIHQQDSDKTGSRYTFSPFVYFYPDLYEAPGLKLVYEHQMGNYGYKATAQGYALHVAKEFTTAGNPANKVYGQDVQEWSENLNVIFEGNFSNYNAGVGYYQNFGNAASHFGTYGNPSGLDLFTSSIYDSMGLYFADFVSSDAKTGYIFGGADYPLSLGKFTWQVVGRITQSPRSDEQSLALLLQQAFNNHVTLGLKLEYFRDTTKAGHSPGIAIGGAPLAQNQTDDRSHMFFTLDYRF